MSENYLTEAELPIRVGQLRKNITCRMSVSVRNKRQQSSNATSRIVGAVTTTAHTSTPEPEILSSTVPQTAKQPSREKPPLSRHNGLLTPFCRRQISFMRNYKHSSRPGPLQ